MMKYNLSNRPFPYNEKWIQYSPFSSIQSAKNIEHSYLLYGGKSIGFSQLSSLKSMGRIPRSHGKYEIGQKYQKIKKS